VSHTSYTIDHYNIVFRPIRRLCGVCVPTEEWELDGKEDEEGDSKDASSSPSCGFSGLTRESISCHERDSLKRGFLHRLSVKELAAMCVAEGVDCSDAVEKDELADRLVARILE